MLESKSYIATPPGATIKEQLEDRDMTQKEFSARMGLSEKHISKLLNGKVHLTPDVAERLEMVLGIPASFWNKLEAVYQEKLVKVQRENELEEENNIIQKYPYKQMAELGIVPDTNKKEEKVISLRKFFGVYTLKKVSAFMPIACRRLADTEKSTCATWVLAQYAKQKAKDVELEAYSKKKLLSQIPKIRKMTLYKNMDFADELVNVLAECGIALIYLPQLQGSFLHGLTFSDNGKIILGITMRGKDADKFWFSLFHEIAHVLEGHIYQSEGTSEADERIADRIAADTLISPAQLESFKSQRDYSIQAITKFAQKIGVDRGIVIGRLQKDECIKYSQLNQYKVKYKSIA